MCLGRSLDAGNCQHLIADGIAELLERRRNSLDSTTKTYKLDFDLDKTKVTINNTRESKLDIRVIVLGLKQ